LLAVGAVSLASGRARLGRLDFLLLGSLAALLGWTWLSTVWSLDPGGSVLEGHRLLLYLAGAAVLLMLPVRVERLLAAVLAAIVVVCAVALVLRLTGSPADYGVVAADPTVARKLAQPVGYANAVGLLAAMGIVLATGRRLAAASLVVLVPTLYFTYGRGAWIALAVGLLVAVAARLRPRHAMAVLAVVAVAGAAAIALGGQSFASEPTSTNPSERLLSLSGSGRAEYWRVALRDVHAHPWLGSGGGSYGRYWLQERSGDLPARDAHSLELETLAELGPLGLALLLGALALPLVAGVRARGHPLAPAALGAYVAYLVHSAVDWDWEVPAVTLAGLACGAALLLLARPETPALRAPAGSLVLVAMLGAAAFVGLVGNRSLDAASDLLDLGRYESAESEAERAARWAPWSSEAWRLRGEAQPAAGKVAQARASFREGLSLDARSWELWLDLGLASDGHAARRAFAHAGALNPHSPELREVGVFGTGE
jgi:O-antigen ligase